MIDKSAVLKLVTEAAARGDAVAAIDAMIVAAKLGIPNDEALAAFAAGKTRNQLGL